MLASANACNCNGGVDVMSGKILYHVYNADWCNTRIFPYCSWVMWYIVDHTVLDLQMCASMAVHSFRISWSNGSSHMTRCCHIRCISNFAWTDVGFRMPRGSKSLDESWSTSHLVVRGEVGWSSPFRVNDSLSSEVFQCSPRTVVNILPFVQCLLVVCYLTPRL